MNTFSSEMGGRVNSARSKNKSKTNPETLWFGVVYFKLVFGFALAVVTEEDPYL